MKLASCQVCAWFEVCVSGIEIADTSSGDITAGAWLAGSRVHCRASSGNPVQVQHMQSAQLQEAQKQPEAQPSTLQHAASGSAVRLAQAELQGAQVLIMTHQCFHIQKRQCQANFLHDDCMCSTILRIKMLSCSTG